MTEHRKAYMKAYRRKWMREKRAANPILKKRESTATREWQRRNPIWASRITYTSRCKRKGVEFRLSHEQFKKILLEDCFYCGAKPNPINTVDRIDSAHGYFVGNVLTACNDCNRAKLDRSLLEFEEWLMRAHHHYFEQERSA